MAKQLYPMPTLEHFETSEMYEGLTPLERRILGKTTRQLVVHYNVSRGDAIVYLASLTPIQRDTLQKFIRIAAGRGTLPADAVGLLRELDFAVPRA